jgi:hypothetical protein
MPGPTVWIITTSASAERPLREIADDLVKNGLSKAQVLDEIGVITGSAPADAVPRLRRVRGVVDVAPDAPVEAS